MNIFLPDSLPSEAREVALRGIAVSDALDILLGRLPLLVYQGRGHRRVSSAIELLYEEVWAELERCPLKRRSCRMRELRAAVENDCLTRRAA